MVGDFNCVISPLDCRKHYQQKSDMVLADLVKTLGYQDAYRLLNPQGEDFTWIREHFSGSRLDRCYVPREEEGIRVLGVSHLASQADHKALVVKLSLPGLPASRKKCSSPYWKLNVAILQDEDFKVQMEKLWRDLEEDRASTPDVAGWWDQTFKPAVTSLAKGYSTMRAKGRKTTREVWRGMLELALEEEDWDQVASCREKLGVMEVEDSWGIVIRSRGAAAIAEGEKAALYHLGKEKTRGSKTSLESLKLKDGEVTMDREKIETELIRFFRPLFLGRHNAAGEDMGEEFTPNPVHLGEFLGDLPRMSEHQQQRLVRPLELEELELAIKDSANWKSPGIDGLSYELYKRFSYLLAPFLLRVFQQILDESGLTVGVTRLLPKVETKTSCAPSPSSAVTISC